MTKKPFVKKFKAGNAFYIFDVNSNEIIRVNKLYYDLMDVFGAGEPGEIVGKLAHLHTEEDIRHSIKEVEQVRRAHQLFSTSRPVIIPGFNNVENIRKAMEGSLSHLIIEVTTRCNLRCKYCSFSGRYSNFRGHGNEDMPRDIALKSIEYFIEHSKKKTGKFRPAIGVYGGEPLLRFDLIKDIVAFTKKKKAFDDYSFNLTTNGTLLTDDVITFLVDNGISITVSLDGPREINDCCRMYPTGKGTYDDISTNLEKVKNYSQRYFENNISINAVVYPPYPFDDVIAFFSRTKSLAPLLEKVRINLVDAFDTTFFRDFGLEKKSRKLTEEISKLRSRYKEALINGRYNELTIEKSFFLEEFYNIACRKMVPLPGKYFAQGTCIPGQRRLFLSTEGKFYMCERVGANYEIGDVVGGLDFKKIFDFLVDYARFFKDCGDCWALRLCKKCFSDVRLGDQLDEERRNSLCKFMLNQIEENLISFCEILEENPDAVKVFQDIEML